MSMRLRNHCLIGAVLILSRVSLSPALAKPPDLPVNEKVDCKEQPKIPLPPGAAEGQAATAKESTQITVAIDVVTPCLCDWLGACVERLVDRLTALQDTRACPYLQHKNCREERGPAASQPAGTVLENLEKPELAREMFERGERHRLGGWLHAAERCYERVQELCPGSEWAHRASFRRGERFVAGSLHLKFHDHEIRNGAEESEFLPAVRNQDLQQARQTLADALRKVAEIDIDLTGNTRWQCEVQVGGVMYKALMDENGKIFCTRQPLTTR